MRPVVQGPLMKHYRWLLFVPGNRPDWIMNAELVCEKYLCAASIGYRGALVIHPSSVSIANDVFSPVAA